MNYRIFYFIFLFFVVSFACFELKIFHSDKDNGILIIGNKNNKLFYEENDIDVFIDPKILKVDYIGELKTILTKHVSPRDSVNKDAEVYIRLFFNPETLKVEEVYFLYRNISPEKVFTPVQMESIEHDLKEIIIANKNVKWINLREIDRQLKGAKYVNHMIGFKVYQLVSFKKGDFAYDKIWIL